MRFNTILAYLSLFCAISVSAFKLETLFETHPHETYSLTLAANSNRVLVSHNTRLEVETFDASQPWNAENVGPDNGRRWSFIVGFLTVISFERDRNGSTLEYTDGVLSTNSTRMFPASLHCRAEELEGTSGFRIKLWEGEVNEVGDLGEFDAEDWKWVNEFGQPDERKNAAIWYIVKTK